MQANHLTGCFPIPVCNPNWDGCSRHKQARSCSAQVNQVFHLATRRGRARLPAPPPRIGSPWRLPCASPGSLFWHLNAPHFSSYKHAHSRRRAEPGEREPCSACHQPPPRVPRPCAGPRGRWHSATPWWHVLKQARRRNAPSNSQVWAPRPAPSRPAPHAPGPRAPGPPCSREGRWPSAVTCGRRRLPAHSTPGSGVAGCFRGSHMRPPGPRASRSRRCGPPRSARIRGAGPGWGANAAPPRRLRLPRKKLPSQSRAVCGLLPGSLVVARDSFGERRPARSSQRLGPDTESKMAPGARGRAPLPARLRPRGRARVRRGAHEEGGGGARPRGSARRRRNWGPPPPCSRRRVCRLSPETWLLLLGAFSFCSRR